jgi:hypothetical protein
MSEVSDIAVTEQDAKDLAKQEPDFLAGLATPDMYEFAWPPVFLAIWAWLRSEISLERSFQRIALGMPRGFAKTSVIKLFILYCILFTDRKFILVLAATATMAENIISDVADMLEEPNIKQLFGDWKLGCEKDTNAVKKFSFRGRPIILAALGAGGAVRGLNIKNARPDVMIFDDVQSREDADSMEVSAKLLKWMLGTAMKAKAPSGCMTLFVGNMYPTPHSILKKLKANKHWVKFIVGGILSSGESLWEELQPVKQLLEEYAADLESGHPEIFHAEVLNDEEAALNNLIDFSKLKEYPYEEHEPHQGNFIIIDPSGDKINSDNVALLYGEVHQGLPVGVEVVSERFSPGETITAAIKLGLERNCYLIAIESVAYQASLLYWFNFVCAQQGIEGFQCVEVYPGRRSKNARILDMFKAYQAGEFYLHERCKSLVHSEINGFNPMKTTNIDNILDCVTYMPKVIEQYGDLMRVSTVEGKQDFDALSAEEYDVAANSPF